MKSDLDGLKCFMCITNDATGWWGDSLTMTHGLSQPVCRRCVVEKQLIHAKERAALIPELEKELAGLGGPHES